ncbi:hypothetical protein VPH35_054057 [Triticum aestivum]|uniref:Uncharacterized protein n=1 Tax=Triticum turgidum subsp. durum TaxID=4567 RepID=A0A9R1QTU0_TRITD|nr:unnamed protein product [Triticum turgidum subsp. durum]
MTQADMMTYIIERLHLRMIKNHESAAQSHAKHVLTLLPKMLVFMQCHFFNSSNKVFDMYTLPLLILQAYIVELEATLDHLKEGKARLKAEEKMILLTKKQMLVEKMMEQIKENVNAKKGDALSWHNRSYIW